MKKRNTPENSSFEVVIAVIKDCYHNHIPVVGKIVEYNGRSGYTVDIDGVKAFLYKSEMSYAYINDFYAYVGKSFMFVITSLDISNDKILVSRKEYVKDLQAGDIVNGIVTEILENRLRLDAGFKANVHIRNISDGFVSDINSMYSIGDTVEIALMEDCVQKGYTECTSKPSLLWEAKTKYLNPEDIVKASVSEVLDNGLKLSINGVIDSFIPTGILSKELKHRFDTNSIVFGEQFEVAIVRIDNDKRKLMLSIDQVSQIREKESIENIKKVIDRGTVLEGCVQAVNRKFAEVLLVGTDIVVKIDRNHLSENKVVDAREEVFEGQILPVIYLGESDGKLIFSRKQLTMSIYPTDVYDLSLDELLAKQGINKNLFVGKAVSMGDDIFFHDVASVGSKFDGESFFEGRLLQDYFTARPSIVLVKNKNWASELVDNEYYQFSITLAPKQIRISQGSPFIYQTTYNSIIKHIENPYKIAVNRVFSKQESPEQNKIIASLLREVGSQLYSEKSRMLFELLQNADDAAPSRNQDKESDVPHVQVAIDFTKDGMLFRHNGCAFNFEDFYSITSAANSTKGVKKRSTGYKGIGFKSVFTNSKSVFILSQGFNFSFDRSNPIFDVSRFDDLYRKVRNFSSEQEERNFFVKYAEQRNRYSGIDDLPWQIMPFWIGEKLPQDLSSPNSDNVVIGLNMDSLSRDEYQTAIEEVFNNPRMFLFLRNTRRLQFSGLEDLSPITIQKDFDPLNNIIRLTSSYKPSEDEIYKIITFSDIEISDKAFEKAGVNIKIKREEKNGIEEYSFVEVYNGIEGKKVNNIPEKIASANFTAITIAFNVDKHDQIVPLKTNDIQSSLYAYLPMNEQRFRFPFFVNADFILSSSREGLQADNKWNVFLFHKIGELVVSALSSIANTNNPKYLKLFPRLFDSTRVATSEIAKTFNKSYSESLQSESFILDENGILRPQDEIIYDNTGLSAIIGNEVFRQLLNTSKYLPSTEIDRTPLLSSPFDYVEIVEPININEILSQGDVSCINSWLNSATAEESRVNFFKWIIEKDEFDLESIIKRLSFISVNKSFTTLESFEDDDYKFILSSNTFGIADILNKLGAICADDNLTDHLLVNFINITEDIVIYDFVKEQDLSTLSYEDRLKLFRSMENWEGVGEAKRKSIRIFKSLNDDLISFNEVLLSRSVMPDWYRQFVISNKELCVGISEYLPESPKESFDKAFNKMLNDGIVTVLEFYNLFKEDKLWSSANTIAVINHFGFDATILDIVEKSDDISKQLFIDKVLKIDLQSNLHYTPDSHEYRILELALSCGKGLDVRRKIFIDSIGLSEYAVNDHISYSYNNTTYQLSLSEILPNHSSENALGKVMSNFVTIPSINILFSQQEKDKHVLRREFIEYIKARKPYLNWAEVAYIALEHLTNSKWANYERSFMVLPEDNDELLKIFNQLIEKGWSALMKTFIDLNYIHFTHIKGKYFDSDSYTLPEEQLPSYIKSWLYSGNMKDQRSDLLILLGAYSSTSNEIIRRRRFLGETSVDADWSITGIALKSFCNWLVKTQTLTNLTPTQKGIIKNLAEKAPNIIIKDFDLPRLENAHEYDDECYNVWRETSTISIYLINGEIPRVYKFNDTVLLRFEEGTVDYVAEKKVIYANANNDLESEMMTMAGKCGVPFTKVNWQELFSVNRSELKREQEENARLRQQLLDMEEGSEKGGRRLKRNDTDEGTQKEINRVARVRAKEYLLEHGYDCQDWDVNIPKKVYKTSKNGKSISFVVASSRGGQIYLHPYKFAIIMESPDNLLLVDDGSMIRGLSFEEAFKGNHDVNLVFDVDYVTPEKMAEIANEMQFYPKANFVIENPDYSIYDELRSFGLSEKHEGQAPTGFSDDEIFG